MKLKPALFFLVISSMLSAHEPFQQLNSGQWDVGYYPDFSGSSGRIQEFEIDNVKNELVRISIFHLSEEYNNDTTGMNFLLEYGISDSLSLGFKGNLIDMPIQAAQNPDHVWRLVFTPFARYKLAENGSFSSYLYTSMQFSPLFSFPYEKDYSNGLMTWLSYGSMNFALHRQETLDLFFYTDIKVLASLFNLAQRQIYDILVFVDENGIRHVPDPELDFGAILQGVLSLGLEFRWGNFFANVGVHLPNLTFARSKYMTMFTPLTTRHYESSPHQLIDLSWRWRFN